MRAFTLLKIAGALVVALVVTAVAVIFNLDLGAYKGDIAAAVKEATGRDLIIEGELRPSIGLIPAISVGRVRFANASWGSRPNMATIESFRAEIELLPVLTGDLRIKRVVLVGADILLETRPDGRGNWMMGASGAGTPTTDSGGPGTIPTVNLVSIEKSRLEFRDGRTGKSTVFKIDRLRARAEHAAAPLEIDLRGSFNGAPVTLDGMLGSLTRVLSGTEALPLEFTVTAGGAKLALKGAIARPFDATGVRIAVSAEGQDLALLGPLASQPLPSIGPYKLAATVSDAGKGWALKDISVVVGQSSLIGEATVDVTTKTPLVRARLTSPLLRLVDFQDRKASTKSGARARGRGDGRVFSADPLPLAALRLLDANLTFRATRIEAPKAVLSDVAVDLVFDGGHLEIKPARLKFAGGSVATEIMVETAGQAPVVAIKLDALGLDLAV
ncbi:MAG: AsmA family protein, partial [Alphaproteobacteria bacterium]